MALIKFLDSFTDWSKRKVGGKLSPTHKKRDSVQGERPPQNHVSSLSNRNRQPVPPGYNPPPHPIYGQFTAEYPHGSPLPPDPTDRPLTPIPESIDKLEEPEFLNSRLFKLLNAAPETSTCGICLEVRDMSEFSQKPPTDKCLHEPSACRTCISTAIAHCLQSHFWTDIRCPTCSEQLEYKDVAEYADEEAFKKYDNYALQSQLSKLPTFRYCLSPSCSFGQIHPSTTSETGEEALEPLINCSLCHFSSCSYHNVPWHVGETCENYEARRSKMMKREAKSEKVVTKTTKICPNKECGRRINKNGGCNHMWCICGWQFCWLCLHPSPGHELKCTRHRTH